MKRIIQFGLFLMILFALIGCSQIEGKESPNTNLISTNKEEPPALKFTIGKDAIKTYRGAYTWSYVDKTTGHKVTTSTDHASPNQMLKTEQGIPINLSEPIKLAFEIEPTQYEIKVWNDHQVIATYNTFEEIKEKGKYIIEIVGFWESGTATYVVALDIQ